MNVSVLCVCQRRLQRHLRPPSSLPFPSCHLCCPSASCASCAGITGCLDLCPVGVNGFPELGALHSLLCPSPPGPAGPWRKWQQGSGGAGAAGVRQCPALARGAADPESKSISLMASSGRKLWLRCPSFLFTSPDWPPPGQRKAMEAWVGLPGPKPIQKMAIVARQGLGSHHGGPALTQGASLMGAE